MFNSSKFNPLKNSLLRLGKFSTNEKPSQSVFEKIKNFIPNLSSLDPSPAGFSPSSSLSSPLSSRLSISSPVSSQIYTSRINNYPSYSPTLNPPINNIAQPSPSSSFLSPDDKKVEEVFKISHHVNKIIMDSIYNKSFLKNSLKNAKNLVTLKDYNTIKQSISNNKVNTSINLNVPTRNKEELINRFANLIKKIEVSENEDNLDVLVKQTNKLIQDTIENNKNTEVITENADFISSLTQDNANSSITESTNVHCDLAQASEVSIKSYYISRFLDLTKIYDSSYGLFTDNLKILNSRGIVIVLNEELQQYITIFKYGSVVFFNLDEKEIKENIQLIHKNLTNGLSESSFSDDLLYSYEEDYKIFINSKIENNFLLKNNSVVLNSLNLNNLSVVSDVMGQTVALDFYSYRVDELIQHFLEISNHLYNTNSNNNEFYRKINPTKIQNLLTLNNMIDIILVSHINLFDNPEASWDNINVYNLYELLRNDFEVKHRYNDIKNKLILIKEDTRFFMELLQNNKSTKLEWIIIILIASEMGIGILSLLK